MEPSNAQILEAVEKLQATIDRLISMLVDDEDDVHEVSLDGSVVSHARDERQPL